MDTKQAMNRLVRLLVLPLAVMLCLALPAPAKAGRSCEAHEIGAPQVLKSMALARQTRDALDASGAQVALIARAGQDLSKYGLRYSHIAFVWRDHPDGRWLVVHELNECGSAQSSLYNQGLGNFFMDDLFQYQAQILLPSAAVQAALVRVLATPTPRRLHQASYNMLSYAFSTKYQNSNQWVLETYAAGASELPIGERAQAQAWLKLAGYQPISLHLSAMTRLGARMFRANVAFDDHPFERRMAGHIDTVTVDAMQRFVKQYDPQTQVLEVVLEEK